MVVMTEESKTKSRFLCMFSQKKTKQQPLLGNTPSTSTASTTTKGEFERLFDYFDENGDGKISPSELRNSMRTVGQDLSEEDAEAVVVSTDSDGDGLLGFDDFVKLVEVEGEEEKGRHLKEAFRVYVTEDDQDCITPKSLRQALRQLGEWKSIDECTVMIRHFDLNGDGVLSFDEFRLMMI